MPRCSFCKKNYEFPIGLSLIQNDGNILYFCSSKCRKNQLKLKRDNKKVNWIRKAETEEISGHKDIIKPEAKPEIKEQKKSPEKKEKPAQKEEKKA